LNRHKKTILLFIMRQSIIAISMATYQSGWIAKN